MTTSFATLLKEMHNKKGVSDIELADMLKTSRAIVSSWENESDIPSRKTIIDISKVLHLSVTDANQLILAAGYIELDNDEIGMLVNSNLNAVGLSFGVPDKYIVTDKHYSVEDLSLFFSSTGTAVESTIGFLDDNLKKIETQLDGLLVSKLSQNAAFQAEIENRLRPLVSDVQSIRDDVVPQLEAAKSQLLKTDEFLRNNSDFFIAAVQGRGKVEIMHNEIDSMEKRLSKIEGQSNITRDRTITIVSVIIAFASMCLACMGFSLSAYISLARP